MSFLQLRWRVSSAICTFVTPALVLTSCWSLWLMNTAAAAAAVKGQVEALLKKFRGFASAPSTGGTATPAAPAGDQDEGDIIKGGVPLAGVDGVQG